MAKRTAAASEELPLDNSARLAIYDALAKAAHDDGAETLSYDDLFERVISRLRVLVPRELHVQGEQAYVRSKIEACLADGVLVHEPHRPSHVRLGARAPRIRYPDGSIRDYTSGLEAARERLDADDAKLRRGGFDVRRLIPSAADDKKSDTFRSLVASMREHGYLDQFPVTVSAAGQVIDGVARVAAAAAADLTMKAQHKVVLPARRDTPLHQALIGLDANYDRLGDDDRERVHSAVEARTGRSWLDVVDDLELTQEWRRTVPKKYTAQLDVDLVAFADQSEPKVQVTTDRTRIGLRSVMQQAGLASYNYTHIEQYVPTEDARTKYSGGRKAIFVSIGDAIVGIETMQRERRERRLKVDSAWDEIRNWLVATFDSARTPDVDAAVTGSPLEVLGEPPLPGLDGS